MCTAKVVLNPASGSESGVWRLFGFFYLFSYQKPRFGDTLKFIKHLVLAVAYTNMYDILNTLLQEKNLPKNTKIQREMNFLIVYMSLSIVQ